MTNQMQVSGYPSEPSVGMNDEEELRRYGRSLDDATGIGDVLFDEADEFVELGLKPE